MLKARDVAQWFVAWADAIEAEVSNLKLQKLLYYAQGHYLADHDQPLFGDDLQAWAHGPVSPVVYRECKQFGRNPIDPDVIVDDDFSWDDFRDVEEFLIGIWNRYGSLAAWALRERTHREAPWKDAFDENVPNAVISKPAIREYFVSANG